AKSKVTNQRPVARSNRADFVTAVWRSRGGLAAQSPSPGASEKYFSNLPSTPSHSLASAGASRFSVILGHADAYLELISSHLSRLGSVSGLMASAGHSGSHTPQSMHSS